MSENENPEKPIIFTFNGNEVHCSSRQSVAAALLENDVRILRETRVRQAPRGIFCGIGTCFDCLVIVDGIPNQRACLIRVRDGLRVQSQ